MNRTSDTLRFFEMLSTLLKGGVNLIDAVSVLSGGEIERPVRETAEKLMNILKKGGGFSEGLIHASGKDFLFPGIYQGIVRSSEKTGKIDSAVSHIVRDLERKIKARETISAAVMYPAAVALIALAGTAVLLYKGIPFFAESGILSGIFLAQAVRSVISAGSFLLASGVMLTFFCYKLFVTDSYEFRIFYELYFLLEGGVSLTDAVTQCIMSIGENKWGGALAYIKKDIISGGRIAAAFEKTGLFSVYITGWLNIGDKNGEIKTVCKRIAEYYQKKDEARRDIVIRCTEPLFIVLTGLYLLFLIQGVILPILTRAGGFI
jgi:type II secretory pathway component PulF